MITHPEIGHKLMSEIVEKLNDISKLEAPPKMEGKTLFAFFLPDKHKVQVYKDNLAKAGKTEEIPSKEDKTEKEKENA